MSEKTYPATWRIASDFDPNDHMMNLKGKAYLNVQNRLLWFIRDQRDFIVRGLGLYSYIVRTELVEQDLERGFAQFKTYVRDVLGNEATMYGSETAKDFGDYAEKASTKSLGRALWALGYGTGMAPEMDEGERVVDSPIAPVERNASFAGAPKPLQPAAPPAAPATTSAPIAEDEPATADQQERMRKYRDALGIQDKAIAVADNRLRYGAADARIHEYITRWQREQRERQLQPATAQKEAR